MFHCSPAKQVLGLQECMHHLPHISLGWLKHMPLMHGACTVCRGHLASRRLLQLRPSPLV